MKEKINNKRIIQAVISCSEKKDLYHITLHDVANELRIKTPSLYNYISGIEDMYLKVGLYGLNILINKLIMSSVGLSGRNALFSITEAYYLFAIEDPVLIDAIENPFISNNKTLSDEKRKIVDLISTILNSYEYGKEKKIHIIRVIRSYLYGFTKLQAGSLHQINVDFKKSFTLGVNAIFDGFELV